MEDFTCDRILVFNGGKKVDLTVDEFFRLPLSERLQLVISGAVKFFAGTDEVEPRTALAALRKRRAS